MNDKPIATPLRMTPKEIARLTKALSTAREKTGAYIARQTLILAALKLTDVDTLALQLAREKSGAKS